MTTIGYIWSMIYKSDDDSDFAGKLPIRQELEILDADEPKNINIGWTVSETIGIGIVNPRVWKFRIHEIYDWKFNG